MSLFGRIGFGYIPFASAFWGFGLPSLGDSLSANVRRAGFTLLGWGNAIVDTDPWRIAYGLWAPWSLGLFGYFLSNPQLSNPFALKIYDPFAQSSETYAGDSGGGTSSTQAADQKKEEAAADAHHSDTTGTKPAAKGGGGKAKGGAKKPAGGATAAPAAGGAAGGAAAPGTTGTPPSGAPVAAKPKTQEEKYFERAVAKPEKTVDFSTLSSTEVNLGAKPDDDSKKLQAEVSKKPGSKAYEIASIDGYSWKGPLPHYVWMMPIGATDKILAAEIFVESGSVRVKWIGSFKDNKLYIKKPTL